MLLDALNFGTCRDKLHAEGKDRPSNLFSFGVGLHTHGLCVL